MIKYFLLANLVFKINLKGDFLKLDKFDGERVFFGL